MVLSDDIVLPPARTTTAWVLFGLCFALLFYGLMLCQGHSYFRTYQEDPADLKVTVAAILLANAVNLGLIMHSCYYYAVMGYATPDAFGHVSSSLVLTPICIFLCIILCEYVYIRRTYLIMPPKCRWVFVVLAVLFVASATAFIITLTVQIAKKPTFQQWLEFKWLVSASFGCSVLGDMGLACILSLALHVSRTGLKRMLSILCLLVAVFEGKNVVIIPLSLAVAKIYANATLVTLNIRRDMSERLTAPEGSELLSLSIFWCAPQQSERREGNVQAPGCSESTLNCEV